VTKRIAAALAVALTLVGCTRAASPHPTKTPQTGQATPARRSALRLVTAKFGLSVPLQREVAVPVAGLIYVAGGLGSSGTSTPGVSSLDPASGRTTRRGSLRQAVHDAAGALLDGKLFVFGGGPEVGTDVVQSFDPASGTSRIAGHLPRALSDLSSATVGGTVYLIGGYDGRSPQAAILATSSGTRFHRVASLPAGLRYPAVAALGSEVIIAGGVTASGPSRDVLLFDPTNGRVRVIGRLPVGIGHASAFVLGDVAYVVGGQDAAGLPVRSMFEIDPNRTHPVRRLARELPGPLSDAAVAEVGGSVYIVGGSNGSSSRQVLRARLQPSG